jgi:hypothetical protein
MNVQNGDPYPGLSSPHIGPIVLAFVMLVGTPAPSAQATWQLFGDPVADEVAEQITGHDAEATVGTSMCTDGQGGLICAYLTGTSEIRVNRLSPDAGTRMWNGDAGLSVTDGVGDAVGRPPRVVADGSGGAWVAWFDARLAAQGIYAQHYDADGIPAFGAGGVLVSDGITGSFGTIDLDADVTPSGKLLACYWDQFPRVQRLSLTGVREFTNSGTAMSSDPPSFNPLDIVSDQAEGAVLFWRSARAGQPGTLSLFANRVGSTGLVQWGPDGITVFSAADVTPGVPHATAALNNFGSLLGFLITWSHRDLVSRPFFSDVHAQKLNGFGALLWGSSSSGAIVHQGVDTDWDQFSSGEQTYPRIATDGTGGAFVVWQDYRDFDRVGPNGQHEQDLYGQRLSNTGVGLWTGNGAPLDTAQTDQSRHRIILSRLQGVIVAYEDGRHLDQNVNALRTDMLGNVVWTGIISGVSNGDQTKPLLAGDGAGGFLCAWDDTRDEIPNGTDVYATHFDLDGILYGPIMAITSPNGGEIWVARDVRTITWDSNTPNNVLLEYSVDAGPRITIDPSTLNVGRRSWEVPDESSSNAFVHIKDVTDGVPRDTGDNPFTICPMFDVAVGAHLTGDKPEYVATGDFNEDGIMDLAIATEEGGNQIAILRGKGAGGVGDGTFEPADHFLAGTGPRALVADDFNDDGILDLAVTVTPGVAVLLGQGVGGVGDGSFSHDSTYATGTNPQGVVTADFNEDGIRDLAVANAVSNDVSILLGQGSGGNGDGTFGSAFGNTVGSSPVRVTAGDFDEDGILDLAVVNNSGLSNSVSVLIGRGTAGMGDGTFKPAVPYAVGANPWGIATGDFNQDDIIDLAVVNINGSSVSILTGDGTSGIGDGTFTRVQDVPAGTLPLEIVTGDPNLDGLEDIVVTNRTQDRISVLYNDRLVVGSFFFGTEFTTDLTPKGIAVGDFREDGNPDLVTACEGDDDVNLYYGVCAGTPSTAVTVVQANGGEVWQLGTEQTLQWTKGAGIMSVDVEISRDAQSWELLARNVTGEELSWTVTGPPTGIAKIRVSDPRAPSRMDLSDAFFTIVDPTVDVGSRELGVAGLGPPRPNPFRGLVQMVLTLPERQPVNVQVFNAAGKRVRILHGGVLPAGRHVVTWDGSSAGGRRQGPGIYFVRARWLGFEQVRKIVLMD